MALIHCKYCDKTVSDRATHCPHCGMQLIDSDPNAVRWFTLPTCDECGAELPADAFVCPNCGCPVLEKPDEKAAQKVAVTSVNLQIKKNTKKVIAIVIILIIIIALAAFLITSIAKKKALEKYEDTFSSTASLIISSAAKVESAGNLIKSVWYNSIYEEEDHTTDKYTREYTYGPFYDDFNDALGNLFDDKSFSSTISMIESQQKSIERNMRELKNPPKEYEEAYESIKKCYDAYVGFSNLVINPTGSYKTFSEDFHDYDNEVFKYFNALKIHL